MKKMAIPISDENGEALTWCYCAKYAVVQHVEFILYMNELPVLIFYVFSFRNCYIIMFFFYFVDEFEFEF